MPKTLASRFLKVEIILLSGMLIECYGYFFDRGAALYVGLAVTLSGAILGVFFMTGSVRSRGVARSGNPG